MRSLRSGFFAWRRACAEGLRAPRLGEQLAASRSRPKPTCGLGTLLLFPWFAYEVYLAIQAYQGEYVGYPG